MAETKPRGEQIRLISEKTGEFLLDAYIEAAERGGMTIAQMFDIIFDVSGNVNPSFISFRLLESPPGTYALQYRAGPSGSWTTITDPVFQQIIALCQTAAGTATTQAAASAASAAAALISQNAAATSASNALTSETNAAASAAQALAAANGMKFRGVRAASTASVVPASVIPGYTMDGVTLAANDRVILKNSSSPQVNGIYVVNSSGAATRATDSDTWSEIVGTVVLVQEGSTQADTAWVCTSNEGGTLGSTNITYANWSQALLDGTITSAKLGGDITATGKSVLTAADAAAARIAIGAAASGATLSYQIAGTVAGNVTNKTIYISLNSPFTFNVTNIGGLNQTGSCTINLYNASGDVLIGSYNVTSSSYGSNSSLSNNTGMSGIYLTITSASSSTNLYFTINCTRALP